MTVFVPLGDKQRMIDKQAEIITKQRETIRFLERGLDSARKRYELVRDAGRFYLQLQQIILDNPILQSEWTRFLAFVRLAEAEDKLTINPVPNIDRLGAVDEVPDGLTAGERHLLKIEVPQLLERQIEQ